jgi:hypothetical protein
MKPAIIIFIIVFGLMTSCYKVYDPHVDTAQKVLAVDGMITNKTDAYHVILTYSRPFNSSEKEMQVSGAYVYITDNLGNSYVFTEKNEGEYRSDSLQFTGIPGRIYRLHIVTSDGTEYESDPQRLFPEVDPDSVYTEFDTKENLSTITGLKVNTSGADILMDIPNKADTIPRFRIGSNLVKQYNCAGLYSWFTDNANASVNLTGGEYSQGSASIKKHEVCFLDDELFCYAKIYIIRYSEDSSYYIEPTVNYGTFMIERRILYLNTYSLNNETYLYYKSLDEQIQSEGKLFDPIVDQLNVNIKCISDPDKKAVGFFEASSVSNSAYIVDFNNLKNSQPSLINVPYILPPKAKGCSLKVPSFWIFK